MKRGSRERALSRVKPMGSVVTTRELENCRLLAAQSNIKGSITKLGRGIA